MRETSNVYVLLSKLFDEHNTKESTLAKTSLSNQSTIDHCVKSALIRSYSGPYFPPLGLNTEKYEVSLHIQSKCEKMRTRITPDTFHAVDVNTFLQAEFHITLETIDIIYLPEIKQTKHSQSSSRIILSSVPVDTGRILNVHKTFRRRPTRLLKSYVR